MESENALYKTLSEFLINKENFSEIEFSEEILNYCFINENIKISGDQIIYDFKITGRASKEKENEITEILDLTLDKVYSKSPNKSIKESIDKALSLKSGLYKNMIFESIKIKGTNLEGKNEILKKINKPMIIDFWATWCNYCQEPMQKLIDKSMYDKDCVYIAISCDEDQSQWKKHLITKNWVHDNVHHLNNKNIREELGIEMLPCVCYVNDKGVVEYFGHPNSGLIEMEKKNLKTEYLSFNEETEKQNFQQIASKFKNFSNIGLCLNIKKEYCIGTCSYTISNSNLIVFGEVYDHEKDAIEKMQISSVDKLTFDLKLKKFVIDEDF